MRRALCSLALLGAIAGLLCGPRLAVAQSYSAGGDFAPIKAKLATFTSVKDFGAKGDGVIDDRNAFANATGDTREKWIPAGSYKIASNVTLGGVWRFDAGALLLPSAGVTITFDTSTMIYAAVSPWIDTSAGGVAKYQAGASQITVATLGPASKTANIVHGFAGNAIAPDVGVSLIAGGGNIGTENLIGYTEFHDTFTGDASTTVWVTSFDAAPATITTINLIRADQVRVTLTSSQFGAVASGSKVQITYPLPGHFVNDAALGAEGTNAALLSTQELYVASNVKPVNAGSGSDYSSILDGYDNIITNGIRQTASGAHHRIATLDGGNHDTIFGGSYGRISDGSYGGIFAGSSNEIACTGSGSFVTGYGNLCSGTGPGTVLGSTNVAGGAFSAALGGTNLTVTGNGAAAVGRLSNVSGQDSFAAGSTQTVSAPFSGADGFTNSVTGTGYAYAHGRQNTVSGGYSSATGFGNAAQVDYTRVAGKHAVARLSFSDVIGGEQIAAAGDAQTSTIAAHRQTTNATATELRLGAATARISITTATTWAFSALISARQTSSTTSAGWKIEGVLKQDGTTVSIVGTPTKTVLGKDAGATAWDVAAAADNTNKAFSLTVTGAAATTINWSARIELAETSG
jgi:hypothetical protein